MIIDAYIEVYKDQNEEPKKTSASVLLAIGALNVKIAECQQAILVDQAKQLEELKLLQSKFDEDYQHMNQFTNALKTNFVNFLQEQDTNLGSNAREYEKELQNLITKVKTETLSKKEHRNSEQVPLTAEQKQDMLNRKQHTLLKSIVDYIDRKGNQLTRFKQFSEDVSQNMDEEAQLITDIKDNFVLVVSGKEKTKVSILNQTNLKTVAVLDVPENQVVLSATGSKNYVFVGLRNKKILVFSKFGKFELVHQTSTIEQPLCMTEIKNKMVVIGLKGGKATGYSLINIQDNFKLENKLSSTARKQEAQKKESVSQGSDIVQIVPEMTKPGFVCVTQSSQCRKSEELEGKRHRDLRLIKEIAPRKFLWYSFTDKSFMTLDSDSGTEEFVTIKGVDATSLMDIILHPGFFEGQNEFAYIETTSGLSEVKRIKLVPGKTHYPELKQYRAAYQKVQILSQDSDLSDSMVVVKAHRLSVSSQPAISKKVYSEEFLEMLP